MSVTIRPTIYSDASAIGELSKEFADYLNSLGDTATVWITPEIYLRDGFGSNPAFSGLVAKYEGRTIGYLLYHQGYDTDYLTRTLHIIDLYVQSMWRRHGVGRRLMEEASHICRKIGGTQLFWSVSTRNEAAIAFYRGFGARYTKDLVFMRLEEPLGKPGKQSGGWKQ